MTGIISTANTIVLRKYCLLRITRQYLKLPAPKAGAAREPVTIAKLVPNEIINIPQVSEPRPRPARYISPILPTKAALTS